MSADGLGRAVVLAVASTVVQQIGEGVREAIRRRDEERVRQRERWERMIAEAKEVR